MDYSRVELWGVLLNIVGICLWGITMLYFVRNKGKTAQEMFKKSANNNMKPFDEEMFAQMVNQESNRSVKRITDNFLKERQMLCDFLEKGELQKAKNLLFRPSSNGAKCIPFQQTLKKPHHKAKTGEVYTKVARLADLGMTPKKITEMVKIPKGEIELIIKLRKKKHNVNERIASGA